MPEQQQGQQDNSLDFLWGMALVIVAIILSWYFGKAHIIKAVFYLRFYEIAAIDFVGNLVATLANLINLPLPPIDLSRYAIYIQKNIGATVSFSDFITVGTVVGSYMRYPLGLLLLVGAYILYFQGPSRRFKHVFDTKSLRSSEQINWPQITPVVKLNLTDKDLDEAPWGFALSPMNFCKKANLLDVRKNGTSYFATLRRGMAYRILSLQLGPRWQGIEALPIHIKALFAIFAARINADKKGAENLIDSISGSAGDGHPNFSGTEELLRKHKDSKKVLKVVGVHGYITTVMASMLVGARGLGVIATAEFIWLKPMDRRMWYMLNSVGRQTAVSEICGAFAHWLAEKKLGLPLMVPMVEEGVRGLEIALSEIIYKPDEEE